MKKQSVGRVLQKINKNCEKKMMSRECCSKLISIVIWWSRSKHGLGQNLYLGDLAPVGSISQLLTGIPFSLPVDCCKFSVHVWASLGDQITKHQICDLVLGEKIFLISVLILAWKPNLFEIFVVNSLLSQTVSYPTPTDSWGSQLFVC